MTWFGNDFPAGDDVIVVPVGADGATAPGGSYISGLVASLTANLWAEARAKLPDLLRAELGQADRLGDGWTLYDIDVRIAEAAVTTFRRSAAGDVVARVVTGVHTVIATTTTPTILGDWADPRFSVDFGMELEYVIDVPPVTAPVAATGLTVLRVFGVRPDSQNLPADLVKIGLGVHQILTGQNLLSKIVDEVQRRNWGAIANAELGILNTELTSLAGKGFLYLDLVAGDAAELHRQLGPAAAGAAGLLDHVPSGTQPLLMIARQPDTSGTVEGEITWRPGEGEPISELQAALITTMASPYLSRAATERLASRTGAPTDRVALADVGRLAASLGPDTSDADLDLAAQAVSATGALATALSARASLGYVSGGPPELVGAPPEAAPPPPPVVRAHADEFRASFGGQLSYELVMDMFRRGPVQLDVECLVPEPGGGTHRTGQVTAMWADDDDRRRRRRFRVEHVETGQPLRLRCLVADGWTWSSGVVSGVVPNGWSGSVTVHPPRVYSDLVQEGVVQLTVELADGERRTTTLAVLEQIGAIAAHDADDRSIIVVGGRPRQQAAAVSETGAAGLADLGLAQRGIIVIGGRAFRPTDELADDVLGAAAVRARSQLDGRARGGRVVWMRDGGLLGGVESSRVEATVEVLRRGAPVSEAGRAAVEELHDAPTAVVDRFGGLELVTDVDPGTLVPDVVDPVGHGTVRGIDFRVFVD